MFIVILVLNTKINLSYNSNIYFYLIHLNVNLNILPVCGEFSTEAIPEAFTPEPDVVLKISKVTTTHFQF